MNPKHFFSITFTIGVPPSHVWNIMSDVENWPHWTPSVKKIRRLDKGPFTVGSRAVIHQPKLPPALWKVIAIDGEHDFTWVSTGPGVKVIARHFIEPAGEGSNVTLSVGYTGLLAPLLSKLTGGLTTRYLNLEAEGLRKECEKTYTM